MKPLLIVESPTKAKEIQRFLGSEWDVRASVGHIRDLPVRALSVSPGTYELTYETTSDKEKVVAGLRAAVRAASDVYLGTDLDREGEAIAWHLQVVLGLNNPKRVVFEEITKKEVERQLAAPRRIAMDLVHAQEARRALDRLVGYLVSGALRGKTGHGYTAGRTQTIGARLVVDREAEIRNFVSRDHWGVVLTFDVGGSPWTAEWAFKPLLPAGEKIWTDGAFAELVAAVRDVDVVQRDDKPRSRSPKPSFTTSTLQQAGSNTLRLGPKKVMQLAQGLFEKGHITYHRTDLASLKADTIAAIREFAAGAGLPLPAAPRVVLKKASTQGAHEAIRPTDVSCIDARRPNNPDHRPCTDEEQRLYEMIRARAIASQLADAEYDVRTVALRSRQPVNGAPVVFIAKGETLRKPGFLAFYGVDPTEDAEPEMKNPVPALDAGAQLRADKGERKAKKTEPPPRYSEASLIKTLEAEGVGRPSTFASIVETIRARNYVTEGSDRKLRPTADGEAVIAALRGNFGFVEVAFTRDMEQHLDRIADGSATYLDVVRAGDGVLQRELAAFAGVTLVGIPEIEKGGTCPTCQTGTLIKRTIVAKVHGKKRGSGGAARVFWSCDRYPTCAGAFNDVGGKPDLTPRVEGGPCPVCTEGVLVQKRNERGPWWSCSRYKDGCKASYRDQNGAPDLTPREEPADGGECPVCCKGRLYARDGARGRFWGCSRFRDKKCSATFPDLDGKPDTSVKPVADGPKCPKCKKGKLRRREGARGAFWGCSAYPKCAATFEDRDGEPEIAA